MNLSRRLAKLEAPHHDHAARLLAATQLRQLAPEVVQILHATLDAPTAQFAADIFNRRVTAGLARLTPGGEPTAAELEALPMTPDIQAAAEAHATKVWGEGMDAVKDRIPQAAYDRWLDALLGRAETVRGEGTK